MIEDSPPNEEIPFVELATRPLEGQPEIRDEARGELMGRLNFAAQGREAEVEAAAARLESGKPGSWAPQAIAMAVSIFVLAAVAIVEGTSTFAEAQDMFGMIAGDRSALKNPSELTPEQDELLRGVTDPASGSPLDFTRLHKALPEDPAIYEGLADHAIERSSEVPQGYRETWQRIDPGNGIWAFKLALARMNAAVDSGGATVLDETAFREAWDAIGEAITAERFASHGPDLKRRYLELLKPPTTLIGRMGMFSLSQYLGYRGFSYPAAQALSNGFKIQARRYEAAKDEAGLQKLIETWVQLARRLAADAREESDMFNVNRLLEARDDLLDVATRMGATTAKERMAKIDHALDANSPPVMTHSREMGLMARTTGGNAPEGAGAGIFTPGRKAEYAFFDQLVVLLSLTGLLVTALIVCIESVRRGRRLNGLADGLAPLFTAADHLWIAGLGAILPLLWYLAITRLTPLGCRDIGIIEFGFPPSLIQSLAAFLLIGVMVVQTARWRITRRAGFLALGGRRLIVGWITALLPAAVIPLTGTVRDISGDTDDFLLAMALACGIPALWLLWQGGAKVFSPAASALDGVLLARKMAWPVMGLVVLLVAGHPLLRASERKWLARDEITRCDPASGGITKLEQLSVERTKTGFLKALGEETDPAK